jgi:hypothetical protein
MITLSGAMVEVKGRHAALARSGGPRPGRAPLSRIRDINFITFP